MVEIICTVITGIASIIVALVGYRISKSHKESEKRAERRKMESILSLEMVVATMELTEVCANALTGGHNNGNVAAAKKKCNCAREKYKAFQKEVVAEEIV